MKSAKTKSNVEIDPMMISRQVENDFMMCHISSFKMNVEYFTYKVSHILLSDIIIVHKMNEIKLTSIKVLSHYKKNLP